MDGGGVGGWWVGWGWWRGVGGVGTTTQMKSVDARPSNEW